MLRGGSTEGANTDSSQNETIEPPTAASKKRNLSRSSSADDAHVNKKNKVVDFEPIVAPSASKETVEEPKIKTRPSSPPPILPSSPVFRSATIQTAPQVEIIKPQVPLFIKVLVKPIVGPMFYICDVKRTDTIARLKAHIYDVKGLPVERQVLTASGIHLAPNVVLGDLANGGRIALNLSVRISAGQDTPTFVDAYDEGLLPSFSSEESSENDDDPPGKEETALSLHSLTLVDDDTSRKEPTSIHCFKCRMRCRLAMNFECRHCKKIFCATHRYTDMHNCGK